MNRRLAPTRVYRFPDLKTAGVPFTRKHVTTMEKRDEFPTHFKLGSNSVGWVAAEVDAWVEERIRRRGPPREAIRAKPRGDPPLADRMAGNSAPSSGEADRVGLDDLRVAAKSRRPIL